MKSIEEKINYYKESFDLFDDGMEKFKFLSIRQKMQKIFQKNLEMKHLRFQDAKLKFG